MTDSQALLSEYVKNASEPAFRELVGRYVGLVYCTALRLVSGDKHAAEDVAQIVFADLARNARTLSKDVMLGGWLHRDTCFVASKILRGERRRQSRERQAAEMNALNDTPDAALAEIAPVLDEAINQLGEKDRAAILLRFFEQRDLSSVGQAMGITQNAVQKRLTRALEKLHILLKHRGVTLSAGALAAALASEAVAAAPAGLATSLSAAALTSMATGGTTLTFLKIMTMTKLKLGVISALVVAGAATPWMIQHQSELKLRAEIRSLQRQLDELGQPRTDYDRSSNLLAQAGTEFSGTKEDMRELLRLRNEVGQLRAQSNDVFRLRAENSQQRSASSARPQINSTEDLAKVPPQDIFPKASWASAGLATPEASLQTFHWATLKGDLDTLATLTSTPEDQARFEKAHEGMSDAQRAARMQDITGYRIVGRTNYLDGPTEVAEVAYYYDGRGIFRGLKFERIGDSWKLAPGQR